VALRRIGALSVIDRDFARLPRRVERERLQPALAQRPRWILVEDDGRPVSLLPAADLLTYLEAHPEENDIDLMEIPAERLSVAPLDFQATLEDAWRLLRDSHVEALYVRRTNPDYIYGILTQDDVERFRAGP